MKFILAALLVTSTLGFAHAGARPPSEGANASRGAGLDMRGMTDDQLRRRMQDACVFKLSEREEAIKTNAVGRCGCYAGNIMRAMSTDEAAELRETGVFGRSSRPKAENAAKSCKV
ncbi:MAG: hypothetical protein JWN07_2887 [Hyphomicrobiales bacterium]|nr:hypothetical protein [Hyphomicrobiales bacterium]